MGATQLDGQAGAQLLQQVLTGDDFVIGADAGGDERLQVRAGNVRTLYRPFLHPDPDGTAAFIGFVLPFSGGIHAAAGVSFTVFLGAMSLQGVTSASIDGVAIRAAKYAVDNFVPVVGGMFSDTMDTLVGCTLIVKNALGVAAVLVLVGALVGPLLRTLAVVFMLRLSAALLEPIADGDIVCAIGDFSRTVVLFFITMLCVGTMYFLLIVQVLLVGNLTVLLR